MPNIEHALEDVIEFSADGRAECLHTESIPLEQLGTLSMKRASSIEWNESNQEWEVRTRLRLDEVTYMACDEDPPLVVRFADASREACLLWEREHFNHLIFNR
jgi:hypothetical protein